MELFNFLRRQLRNNVKQLMLMQGVFCTSLSVLTLELTLTRIASVVMYYHFSFLAVSLALLGLGIGGIYLFLFGDRFPIERFGKHAAIASSFHAVSALLSLVVLLSVRLNLQISWSWLVSWAGIQFVLVIVFLIVPFFFGGVTLSLVWKHYGSQVSKLYFADLVGAGSGCLLLIPAFEWLGGMGTVTLVSLLPVLAALTFALIAGDRRHVATTGIMGVVLLLFGIINAETGWVRIRFPKGELETTPVYEKWNAYSRVAVYPPNLLSKNFERWDPDKGIPVDRIGIDIDAGAFTSIVKFDGDLSKLIYLRNDIAAVPYRLSGKRDVLIIGSGGGQDVLIALLFGARRVTAVEMNPIMFTIVNDRFGDFSGRLYQHPEVRAVVDEARSFIHHSPERYDLIQGTLVDTFAASAAGAYALSENYLYTQEAFADYWDHLKDDGILAMTRWYQDPPTEILRLTTLALAVMQARGIPHPERHIVVTRQEFRSTFLLKKGEFLPSDFVALQQGEDEGGYEIIYAPNRQSNPLFSALFANPDQFIQGYTANIQAPTDDKPFFFYSVKPANNPLGTLMNMLKGNSDPSALVGILFLLLLVLACIFIFLPLIAFADRSIRHHPGYLSYFASLGLGFALIEIAMIQKFILFLGHPIYAISVVLFSLLLFGGVGSYLSGHLNKRLSTRARLLALACLVVMLLTYQAIFPWFTNAFIGLNTGGRVALTVLALCPVGLLMGMPFPLGIKRISESAPALVPWMWGVNGALSVVGSVMAAILAINYGLSVAFLVGILAYVAALTTTGIQFVTGQEARS